MAVFHLSDFPSAISDLSLRASDSFPEDSMQPSASDPNTINAFVKVVMATVPEPMGATDHFYAWDSTPLIVQELTDNSGELLASVKVASATVPGPIYNFVPATDSTQTQAHNSTFQKHEDSWKDIASGVGKKLQKKGTPFVLPSG